MGTGVHKPYILWYPSFTSQTAKQKQMRPVMGWLVFFLGWRQFSEFSLVLCFGSEYRPGNDCDSLKWSG